VTYRVELDDRAIKELKSLPQEVITRMREVALALARDPRPPGARKLTGRDGYRIRVGDYRVLYEIEDTPRRVRVYRIGHRREVYR
jgi:mRNA interferase RelE/StbE